MKWRLLTASLIPALASSVSAARAPGIQVKLDETVTATGHRVDAYLKSDEGRQAGPDSSVTLSTEEVTMGSGMTVARLLHREKIAPSPDAYGLVYDLNPALIELSRLKSGVKIRLPKVQASGALANRLAEGAEIDLALDRDLKSAVVEQARILDRLQPRIETLPPSRFPDTSAETKFKNEFRYLVNSVDSISLVATQRLRPINRQNLLYAKEISARLARLGETLVTGSDVLTMADRSYLDDTTEDMQERMKSFTAERNPFAPPPRPHDVVVTVKLLDQEGKAAPTSALRIYYVPRALRNSGLDEPFEKVEPPTQRLPEAYYFFWAVRAGKADPATEVLPFRIRYRPDAPSQEIQLVVLKPGAH